MTIGTKAAYARHRKGLGLSGGTNQGVQKAVDSGRIHLRSDGRINFEIADADWSRNTSVEQQERGKSGGKSQSAAGGNLESGEEQPEPEDYLTARARKEAALADLAEMEAAELRGELVRTGDVVSCWGEMISALRARLLVLPSMAAPQVASPGRALEVQGILAKLVNEALSELSDGVPESVRRRKARHAEDSPTTA